MYIYSILMLYYLGVCVCVSRSATGESWQEIMLSCLGGQKCETDPAVPASDPEGGCGSDFAYFYFVSFIFFSSFLVKCDTSFCTPTTAPQFMFHLNRVNYWPHFHISLFFSRCWTCLLRWSWTILSIWPETPPSWGHTTWTNLSGFGESMIVPPGQCLFVLKQHTNPAVFITLLLIFLFNPHFILLILSVKAILDQENYFPNLWTVYQRYLQLFVNSSEIALI